MAMAPSQGIKRIQIRILGDSQSQPTSGEVNIQEWTKQERTMRAVKFGGACWVMAIISVIIPLMHFVLVPGFLIAGPIVAFFVLAQESVLLNGEGTCPYCKASLPISRGTPQFPLSELCSACHRELRIEKESSA